MFRLHYGRFQSSGTPDVHTDPKSVRAAIDSEVKFKRVLKNKNFRRLIARAEKYDERKCS